MHCEMERLVVFRLRMLAELTNVFCRLRQLLLIRHRLSVELTLSDTGVKVHILADDILLFWSCVVGKKSCVKVVGRKML